MLTVFSDAGGGGLGSPTGGAAAPSSAKKCRNMALDHHCKLDKSVDLPQVDHGEGGRGGGRARGRERATRATKSRVVDLCRLQEFKSH